MATRTNLHASSHDFKKIIKSPSVHLMCFFIGSNESSHHELSNGVFLFFKFQIGRLGAALVTVMI